MKFGVHFTQVSQKFSNTHEQLFFVETQITLGDSHDQLSVATGALFSPLGDQFSLETKRPKKKKRQKLVDAIYRFQSLQPTFPWGVVTSCQFLVPTGNTWKLVANGRTGTDIAFELYELVTLYNSVFICVFVNLSNDDIDIRFSGGCDV